MPRVRMTLSCLIVASLLIAGVASAQSTVDKLVLTVDTGSDDLRGGAVAFGQLLLSSGRSEPKVNLNGGSRLDSNSSRVFSLQLSRPLALSELTGARLRVSHDGSARNAFESYDNWDVKSLRVSTPRVCTGGDQIASASGAPWHRFSGESPTHRLSVRSPSTLASQTPGVIVLTLRTGRDDRRSGSASTVQVRLSDGRTAAAVPVHAGSTLAHNSDQTIQLPLPAGTRTSSIASVDFRHDGAARNVGETYDNWNVDRVSLALPTSCKERALGAATGKRLTGSSTSFDIPLQP